MANREENNEGHKFTVKYVGLNGMECEGKLPRRVVGVRNHCYLLKSKIGEGSFSAVWRAEQRPPTGDDVAVKQVFLSKLNPRLKACLDCEINFLSSVNHPNTIRLLHFFQVLSSFSFHFTYFPFSLPWWMVFSFMLIPFLLILILKWNVLKKLLLFFFFLGVLISTTLCVSWSLLFLFRG